MVCLAPLFVASAAQVDANDDVGRAIGRIIAAGVVLSSSDFAAGATYDVDDDSDTTMAVTHFGYRQSFRKGRAGPIPFFGVTAGRVVVDQHLDLGGPVPDASTFETRGVGLLGGARFPIRGGWFAQGLGGLEYSWAEAEVDYRSPQSEALAPSLDGIILNWEAEALTTLALGGLGYHKETSGELTIEAGGQAMLLRTNPVETDHPVQDVTTTSDYERLYAVFDIPLGVSLGGCPLRITPGIAHTFLDEDLADPLDSDKFTEVRVGLAAILSKPGREALVERVGLSVGYTYADAFDGWSFGLVLSPWHP